MTTTNNQHTGFKKRVQITQTGVGLLAFVSFPALTSQQHAQITTPPSLLLRNLDTLPQALNLELLTRAPAVDVLDVIGRCLKVAGGVVALGDEDLVLGAIVEGLVQGDRGSHKLLLDLAEALQTGLELQVVVRGRLGNGRDNGDPVALGADVVCGGNAGNVDVLRAKVSQQGKEM